MVVRYIEEYPPEVSNRTPKRSKKRKHRSSSGIVIEEPRQDDVQGSHKKKRRLRKLADKEKEKEVVYAKLKSKSGYLKSTVPVQDLVPKKMMEGCNCCLMLK